MKVRCWQLDLDDHAVIMWWSCGHSAKQLAEKMRVPVHKVRRTLRRIVAEWRKRDGNEPARPARPRKAPRRGSDSPGAGVASSGGMGARG
jgi:hypothetical protein